MNDLILSQLKQMIAQDLDLPVRCQDIDESSSLFEGGIGLDSMAIMDLITLVEDRFQFEFADAELSVELFQSLNSLAQFVARKVEAGQAVIPENTPERIAFQPVE